MNIKFYRIYILLLIGMLYIAPVYAAQGVYEVKKFYTTEGVSHTIETMNDWIKKQNPDKIKVVTVYNDVTRPTNYPTMFVVYINFRSDN